MSQKVVTRFAPSPTGFLHVGGVRTALFSYIYARQNKGEFTLRIEDTDKARNREEWTNSLIDDLKWLGIKHDTFVKQSDRTEIYKKYLKILIDNGQAYISKETPSEEGERDEVIRFKNPNKKIIFSDLIRGEVCIDTTDLGDFVIARSLDEPLYHLAVVVDDFEMGITHVIRAEEHISNTPRQILIQEGIGANRPIYAHLPLVLATDKSKLSKRKHGESVSLTYYRNLGYLPQGILNYVALLGWNPGTDREIFTLEELIEEFKIEKIQKGGAVFDVIKLNWFNKQYIAKMDEKTFIESAGSFLPKDLPPQIISLLKEKISYFAEIPKVIDTEFLFMLPIKNYDSVKLAGKSDDAKSHLKKIIEIIPTVKDFTKEKIKDAIWAYAEEKGRGNVLWPMRYALSGQDKSPDPFIIAEIIGKEETLSRLNLAHEAL